MKTKINITCERCGKKVHGVIIECPNVPKFTGGFYDVSKGTEWHEFAKSSTEKNICNYCMWDDTGFTKKYGKKQKFPE